MDIEQAAQQFDMALADFARARSLDPKAPSWALLERVRVLMTLPAGLDRVYLRVRALESAGISSEQALWQQIQLKLSPETEQELIANFGDTRPARVFLLAGVLNLLGSPLGVGQGNNPSCQSAIGLSMWASNEADYLLQVLAWAARDNEVLTRFEGNVVSSRNLKEGLMKEAPVDVDPVSLIVIPHLDRIYGEMWRPCPLQNSPPDCTPSITIRLNWLIWISFLTTKWPGRWSLDIAAERLLISRRSCFPTGCNGKPA